MNRACSEGFPDLAREMGLGFLGSDNVDERLLTEGKEDEVNSKQCKWAFSTANLFDSRSQQSKLFVTGNKNTVELPVIDHPKCQA